MSVIHRAYLGFLFLSLQSLQTYAQKITLEVSGNKCLRYSSIAFENEHESKVRLRPEPSIGIDSRLSLMLSERWGLFTGYKRIEYNAGWSAETVGYYRQQFVGHNIPLGVEYYYSFGKKKQFRFQGSLSLNYVIVQNVNIPFFSTDYYTYNVFTPDKVISWVSEGVNNNSIKNHLVPEVGLGIEWWPSKRLGLLIGSGFQYSGGLIGTSNAKIDITSVSTGVIKTTRLSTRDYKSQMLVRFGIKTNLVK